MTKIPSERNFRHFYLTPYQLTTKHIKIKIYILKR
nr:MAG TPA: hypothetical protein [Caudoviricetes sp.]